MKTFFAVLTGMTMVLAAVPARAAETMPDIGQTIHVKAKGLVCDYCVRAVEKMLKQRREVDDFKINLTTKRVDIRLKKGESLDDKTVSEIIAKSGYSIESITRE